VGGCLVVVLVMLFGVGVLVSQLTSLGDDPDDLVASSDLGTDGDSGVPGDVGADPTDAAGSAGDPTDAAGSAGDPTDAAGSAGDQTDPDSAADPTDSADLADPLANGLTISPDVARDMLPGLTIADPHRDGYSRELFPHWENAIEFGWPEQGQLTSACHARSAALLRDGRDVIVGKNCKVSGGRWMDPMTGETMTDPAEIDIDHVVPLAEAWRSGAWDWSTDQRARFANDPLEVVVSDRAANRAKGSSRPDEWRPERQEAWCLYATRWIAIKQAYDLTLAGWSERAALGEMLDTCP
jgi:hypothetical protein